MKTAIIKTDFWKQDKIYKLLPDARHFYLCLLTNPERNTTPAFQCNDRLMMAYTGYNSEVIKLCQKELIKKGLVQIVEGFYVINEQDYVQLTRGKLSRQLYERDYELLPLKVRESLRYRSGAAPDYKDKDNNKDKSIVKNKDIEPEAIRLSQMLHAMVKERYNFTKERPNEINRSAKQIELLHTRDNFEYQLIEAVLRWSQENTFWQRNIRSGDKLRKQFEQLLIQIKSERDKINDNVTVA